MTQTVLGIIGGSGLYNLPNLQSPRWEKVASPWGEPSDEILFAEIEGLPIRFLPRHGRGHRISPTDINYRANIDALKRTGVTDLVSISACGSFREELAPGTFVLVDQFIDRTFARAKSFFGTGLVAHVSVADPVSPGLVTEVEKALQAEKIAYRRGGTYLVMEGPQFSTRAESNLYRSWGCDVIGMTNMPEAKRDNCHGHRLRLLARRSRSRGRRFRPRRHEGQHGAGTACHRPPRRHVPARAPALSNRVRPGARRRADHRARGP